MVEENRSESSEEDRPGDDDLAKRADAFEAAMKDERSKRQAETAQRQRVELELAEVKGKVDALSRQPTRNEEFSRPDLQKLVDDGRLSQEEADRKFDEQQGRRIDSRVKEAVETTIGETTQKQRVQGELDRYKAAISDLLVEGTPARAKAAAEYEYLVGLGQPKSVVTELAAVRAAFGPVERLVKGKTERETDQAVGSDGGEETPVKDKSPKGLTADAKRYYERQIEAGQYKDWDAVTKALSRASPGPRQRLVRA